MFSILPYSKYKVNETMVYFVNEQNSSSFAFPLVFPQKRRTVRHYKVVTESLIEEQLQLSFRTI